MARSTATMNLIFLATAEGWQAVSTEIRKTSGELGGAGDAGDKAKESFRGVTGGFVAMMAGMQMFRGILGFLAPGRELDSALATLRAHANMARLGFDNLREAAMKAAAETIFSPTEAVEGLIALKEGGVSTEQALKDLLPTVLKLAQATGGKLSVAEAANLAGTAYREFGKRGADLINTMNQLFFVSLSAGAAMKDMVPEYRRLAQASALGAHNMTDLLAVFGLTAGANRSVASTGQGVISMLRQMAKLSVRKALFTPLGIDATIKSGRLGEEVITKLMLAYRKMGDVALRTKMQTIFGAGGLAAVAAVPGVVTAVKKLSDGLVLANGMFVKGETGIRDYVKALESANEIERFSAEQMKSFNARLERLRENWDNLLIRVGEPTLGVLGRLVSGLTWLVGAINGANSATAKFLSYGAGIVTTLVASLGGVFLLTGALRLVRVAFSFVAKELALIVPLLTWTAFKSSVASLGIGRLGASFSTAGWQAAGFFGKVGIGIKILGMAIGKLFMWVTVLTLIIDIVKALKEAFSPKDPIKLKMEHSVGRGFIEAGAEFGEEIGEAAEKWKDPLANMRKTLNELDERFKTKIPVVDLSAIRGARRTIGRAFAAGSITEAEAGTQLGELEGALKILTRPGKFDADSLHAVEDSLDFVRLRMEATGISGSGDKSPSSLLAKTGEAIGASMLPPAIKLAQAYVRAEERVAIVAKGGTVDRTSNLSATETLTTRIRGETPAMKRLYDFLDGQDRRYSADNVTNAVVKGLRGVVVTVTVGKRELTGVVTDVTTDYAASKGLLSASTGDGSPLSSHGQP